ncbi:FKBP-like peptidyl-prolyl cis-trans isomerase family protein isoform X2 [Tasmannia lanceolata]|uniref:FKBP-like peptidyl-prolyl cis-trans isomerase family protein isoform X2 n=1 Tax=Tasmannia lanceolata TaxID=3420 RepID=UPI00406491D8
MELSLRPSPLKSLCGSPRKRPSNRKLPLVRCCCSNVKSPPPTLNLECSGLVGWEGRRRLIASFLAAATGVYTCDIAGAVTTSRRALKGAKIPESDFTTLSNGLKYYDFKVGGGPEAVKGSRVAPYGFDVGQSEKGNVLKGLDLGVQGMRVGGQRLLIVPPELAYGSRGVQEIPPNATIELDVELLSIKQSPFGTGVKLVEG